MPGVDDGGEPLTFEANRPVQILSTGQPVRIEIAQVTMPAQVERVVFPERGMAAHLRATATLSGPRPLWPVRSCSCAAVSCADADAQTSSDEASHSSWALVPTTASGFAVRPARSASKPQSPARSASLAPSSCSSATSAAEAAS